MFDNQFKRRMKDLANRAGLKIDKLESDFASLVFRLGDHRQPLFVSDYDGTWEFQCPSIIAMDDSSDIPHFVLCFVLEQNARNRRGFWCIETLGGKKTIAYMHNVQESTLTPDEFSRVCWQVVREVEAFESAMRSLIT